MKQFFALACALILSISVLHAQSTNTVLFYIDGKPFYLTDFESAYKKNSANMVNDKGSIESFLQSYIDSKISVEEALKQCLDTTSAYKYQYDSYRIQAIAPYLQENDYRANNMDKMSARGQQDIKINHVLIPFGKTSYFPSDTLKAYNEAMKMHKKLQSKGFIDKSFVDYSLNPEIVADFELQNGYLGWVSPFSFSTPVEDVAYSIPLKQISMPIRSSKGYHIIEVLDRQPNAGFRTIEQVVFTFRNLPPTRHDIDSVTAVVQNIYKDMKGSEGFNALCYGFAHAYGKEEEGCVFGEISLDSKLPTSFIHAAFELKNVGDVSNPVVSNYGVHLLRLVAKRAATPNDAQQKMMNKMQGGDRGFYYSANLYQYLYKKYGLSLNEAAYRQLADIANKTYPTDSTFTNHIKNGNDVLFTLGDTIKYKVKDFFEFLKLQKPDAEKSEQDMIAQLFGSAPVNPFELSTDRLNFLFDKYAIDKLRGYIELTVEDRNPEVKEVLNSYAEGILLFDVKNRNVWRKAQSDNVGLEEYFKKNKSKYKWSQPQYKGYIITCTDQATLDQVKVIAEKEFKSNNLEAILNDTLGSDIAVDVKKGLWAKGQNEYVDYKIFSGSEPANLSQKPYFVVVGELLKAPQTMEDVKGEVVSDYQDEVERVWLKNLKAKYSIVIDRTALKTLGQ